MSETREWIDGIWVTHLNNPDLNAILEKYKNKVVKEKIPCKFAFDHVLTDEERDNTKHYFGKSAYAEEMNRED